jgi:hypothetical protein
MPTIVNKWKGFCGDGLPPIKEVMGRNLVDRSIGMGYGERAYKLNAIGRMAKSIILELTKAEARALDALVHKSAMPFFMSVSGDEGYRFQGWTKESAARACDKLREAVLGEPSSLTWTQFLSQQG